MAKFKVGDVVSCNGYWSLVMDYYTDTMVDVRLMCSNSSRARVCIHEDDLCLITKGEKCND